MKLATQLALATTSLALGLTVLDVQYASAAIINYAFRVESPTRTGQGFFSFDDTTFSNDNIPVARVNSLSFTFDGESTPYTEQDDVNYPNFPLVFQTEFLTGQSSIGLDYWFNDRNPGSDLSYQITGADFTAFSTTSPNNELISGSVSNTKIPEPATLAGSLVACGVGLFLKRKGISIKKVEA